jgi:hypothetical protein
VLYFIPHTHETWKIIKWYYSTLAHFLYSSLADLSPRNTWIIARILLAPYSVQEKNCKTLGCSASNKYIYYYEHVQ